MADAATTLAQLLAGSQPIPLASMMGGAAAPGDQPTFTASDALSHLYDAWQRGSANYARQLGPDAMSLKNLPQTWQSTPGLDTVSGFGPGNVGLAAGITDAAARWSPKGGWATQLTAQEANDLHAILEKSNLDTHAERFTEAKGDLGNKAEEVEMAEKDDQKATSEDERDEIGLGDHEEEALEHALEVHKHLKALAEKSTSALSAYEDRLTKAGIGSMIQSGDK